MKLLKLTFVSTILLFSLLWTACEEPCTPDPDPMIGTQSFTVEYRNDDGDNLLTSLYNQDNITVFVDFDGGERPNPQYTLIEPGFEGGKFGPFRFTEMFYDSTIFQPNILALLGRTISYDYYIEKDIYGTDKFTVSFLLSPGACNEYWASIKYFLNDEELTEYSGQFNPEIVIVE